MTAIYKNPRRASSLPASFKPYTPEYKKMGLEPMSNQANAPFGGATTINNKFKYRKFYKKETICKIKFQYECSVCRNS